MTQSLKEMLDSLPTKEDIANKPMYCKWCGTDKPIAKSYTTHGNILYCCQNCSILVKRTEHFRSENDAKAKWRRNFEELKKVVLTN